MTFEESIAEMKRHSEARLKQEEYLNKLNGVVTHIKNVAFYPNELKRWRNIEDLIRSHSAIKGVNEDHVRDLLLKGE